MNNEQIFKVTEMVIKHTAQREDFSPKERIDWLLKQDKFTEGQYLKQIYCNHNTGYELLLSELINGDFIKYSKTKDDIDYYKLKKNAWLLKDCASYDEYRKIKEQRRKNKEELKTLSIAFPKNQKRTNNIMIGIFAINLLLAVFTAWILWLQYDISRNEKKIINVNVPPAKFPPPLDTIRVLRIIKK